MRCCDKIWEGSVPTSVLSMYHGQVPASAAARLFISAFVYAQRQPLAKDERMARTELLYKFWSTIVATGSKDCAETRFPTFSALSQTM